MREEDGFEIQDKHGYRSLWEMFQGPVRDTVRARGFADPERPDGLSDLPRIG
jgi:hypothetical protein